jgi:creatinine amidohydrolase
MARSVHRAGARKLVLFNSHGGQMALMDIACRDIRIELGMLAVGCSWFRITAVDDLFSAAEISHGIHGGDIETSMMLAIAPEKVDMEKAEDFVPLTVEIERSGSPLTAEGAVGFGWQAQDLHPAGVCGDASAATAEKGGIVLDRAANALSALIAATGRFDMRRLTPATRFSGKE